MDLTPLQKLEECRHRPRDNRFGVTWCTICGRLFTKPSGKPLTDWIMRTKEDLERSRNSAYKLLVP
jgi:hypothetical protein